MAWHGQGMKRGRAGRAAARLVKVLHQARLRRLARLVLQEQRLYLPACRARAGLRRSAVLELHSVQARQALRTRC